MGSFQRAFLGYRRPEVDAAISARDSQISAKDARIAELSRELLEKAEAEEELAGLSAMVIEREREIRSLNERLEEANARYDRGIASLDAVSARLGEIEAQARGQATRIRMKALREAVEVGRRAQEYSEAETAAGALDELEAGEAAIAHEEAASSNGHGHAADRAHAEDGAQAEGRGRAENFAGIGEISQETFEGKVHVEIGPLGDYSQLVGIEDAIDRIGASEISIQRFSEGRATLSMNLDEPVELLRALEEHAAMEFRVRHAADDSLVIDVDDDSEHRAA
jgi:hypothetical protein